MQGVQIQQAVQEHNNIQSVARGNCNILWDGSKYLHVIPSNKVYVK